MHETRLTHTPRPWSTGGTFNPDSNVPTQHIWGPRGKHQQSGVLVAQHARLEDAPLIAAAPDLLEACEALELADQEWANCSECSEALSFPELCTTCMPLYDDARLKRRAAIAKAKGEQ